MAVIERYSGGKIPDVHARGGGEDEEDTPNLRTCVRFGILQDVIVNPIFVLIIFEKADLNA